MHDDDQPSEPWRRTLDAWTAAEPPPGFADRVVAAAAVHDAAAQPPNHVTPRFRWPRLAAAAIAAAAIAGTAVAAFNNYWPGTPAPTGPSRATVQGAPIDDGTSVDLRKPTAQSTTAAHEVPADLKQQIDAYIGSFGEKYGDAFKFQGSLIVARRGEVLYAGHFGRTDTTVGTDIDEHTRFKVGSLTQQFTAVAVLQLRDEGKLTLDDRVQQHIRDFPHRSVTIRQLLSHTSGVPSYTDSTDIDAYELEANTVYPPAKIRAMFESRELEFPPGSDFDLSNSGYFLLGLIVESASHDTLAAYLQRRIFSPAGMTHTSLGGETRQIPGAPLATGHEFSEEELLLVVPGLDLASVYGGAAGIVSTPADLVRWDAALHTPGALLSQASIDEMFTPVRDDYGLGWIVTRVHGQTFVGHPGGVEGFNGAIARYLGDGLTVLALANTEAIDCRDIVEATSEILHGGTPPIHTEHDELAISPAELARYLGDYKLTDASRKKLGRLIDPTALSLMENIRVYDDHGRLFLLVSTHGAKWLHRSSSASDRFFFKDPAGTVAEFGPPGAPVTGLTLRQRGIEFVLEKSDAGDFGGFRVTPGAFR